MNAHAFDAPSLAAVYDVIASRRDIRRGFTMEPIGDAALSRILAAAHQAPSVGLSQPWDFLLLRDVGQRQRIQAPGSVTPSQRPCRPGAPASSTASRSRRS